MYFFFFKQKTAYEMRISDWSSACALPISHHATQHDRTGGKAMLKRVEDGPAVVACSTCRHSSKAKEDAAGVRGGARMVEALRAVKESEDRKSTRLNSSH